MEAQDKARWTWHLISWVAPVSFGILFLVLMVALIGFEPFIFVIAIITLVAGYVGRRFPRRAGPITVAAVMTLLILGNLPALIDDLAHPDSFVGFALFGVVAVAFALAAIIASIAILIGRPDDGATRVVYTAIGVMVIGMAVSIVATLGLEDDAVVSGDLRIIAEDVEFAPVSLNGSGTVGVFIENKDPIRHTFAIEALDLEVELPAGTDRRVDIAAEPGTYEFVCTVPDHDKIKGTLTISG